MNEESESVPKNRIARMQCRKCRAKKDPLEKIIFFLATRRAHGSCLTETSVRGTSHRKMTTYYSQLLESTDQVEATVALRLCSTSSSQTADVGGLHSAKLTRLHQERKARRPGPPLCTTVPIAHSAPSESRETRTPLSSPPHRLTTCYGNNVRLVFARHRLAGPGGAHRRHHTAQHEAGVEDVMFFTICGCLKSAFLPVGYHGWLGMPMKVGGRGGWKSTTDTHIHTNCSF